MKLPRKLLFVGAATGIFLVGDLIGNLLPGIPGFGKGPGEGGGEKAKESPNKAEEKQPPAPEEPQETMTVKVEMKNLLYSIDGNVVGDCEQLNTNIINRIESAKDAGKNPRDIVFDLTALSNRKESQDKIRRFVDKCGAITRP